MVCRVESNHRSPTLTCKLLHLLAFCTLLGFSGLCEAHSIQKNWVLKKSVCNRTPIIPICGQTAISTHLLQQVSLFHPTKLIKILILTKKNNRNISHHLYFHCQTQRTKNSAPCSIPSLSPPCKNLSLSRSRMPCASC